MRISDTSTKAQLKKQHTLMQKAVKWAKILQFIMITWLVYCTVDKSMIYNAIIWLTNKLNIFG
jgi:hypothetical protein